MVFSIWGEGLRGSESVKPTLKPYARKERAPEAVRPPRVHHPAETGQPTRVDDITTSNNENIDDDNHNNGNSKYMTANDVDYD